MVVNRYNLPRSIPAEIKRQIRQRDGFGCIVCGNAYYQFDHIGTEFRDAVIHDPLQIILLCGKCHDRKTRGVLSTETLLLHAKSPRCKQIDFSRGELDIGTAHPEIVLGTITAKNVRSLLTIDEEEVFSILPPQKPGEAFRINASLYNQNGDQTLKIFENEFQISVSNWDAEIIGQKLKIRSQLGKFNLVLRVDPPKRLIIEQLDMVYKNFNIECREGRDTIIKNRETLLKTSGAELDGCDIAILVKGLDLSIGVGGGSVHITKMNFSISKRERPQASSVYPNLFQNGAPKLRRNEKCFCGTGKKYKYCHGRLN